MRVTGMIASSSGEAGKVGSMDIASKTRCAPESLGGVVLTFRPAPLCHSMNIRRRTANIGWMGSWSRLQSISILSGSS